MDIESFKYYVFYDLETTGINPAFDQILQFAAVRTDLDFNEIMEILTVGDIYKILNRKEVL